MPTAAPQLDTLQAAVLKHWGFRSFRPLQEETMQAVLAGRDSLLVLPTGGGKSLCYQAPAVVRGDTTVVVSPLISLMKDQVDALRSNGVPAVQLNSAMTDGDRQMANDDLLQGSIRLLFVAPERLVQPGFLGLLKRINVQRFAIDEAHCISHWGHDFRPEYRELRQLKEHFPQASVHGFTATATEQVRRDIAQELGLKEPLVLVGNFDRPNLTYRVLPKVDLSRQVCEVLDRHKNEAGIIYCIRRKDVDSLTEELQARKYKALPYHAGLSPEQRKSAQDAFAAEECDLIVATVAFGMGIDRSNVRFVLHTGMPKTIEHYQQETGRAGRDGLEAECVLLYSGQDVMTWRFIIEKSAEEAQARAYSEAEESGEGEAPAEPASRRKRQGSAGASPSRGSSREFLKVSFQHLDEMDRYCRGAVCRHKSLVGYFGQKYERDNCQACDHCLGDTEPVPDAAVIAQKILSCVARVKERFGAGQVISVLRGENTERVRANQHDQLSTYGLLRQYAATVLRNWIHQLISQDVLVQEGGEYPILRLNAASWEVMKGQRDVRLLQPVKQESMKSSKADASSWEGVDRPLFDALRELRHDLATKKAVPPYVIFSDATLRELARVRPSTLEKMRLIYGIGDAKLRDYGPSFLERIDEQAEARELSRDQAYSAPASASRPTGSATISQQKQLAYKLFREQAAVEDVMHQTGRARATVWDYLAEFIRETRPATITAWVPADRYQQIAAAVGKLGDQRLKPIFIELGEKISYDEIRLVVAHLAAGK